MMFKNFWIKLGNEKFTWRIIVGGCTFLSTFTLMTTEPPASVAWAMGVLNGFLILEELRDEFEDEQ